MKKPKQPPCPPVNDAHDLLDEMCAKLTSDKKSEVGDLGNDWPEGTITPDKEMTALITDVIGAADEFRPMHEKLKDVIERHRTKIILLKSFFGVRKGRRGNPVLLPGHKSGMYWDEFVDKYFGVTAHRLNELLSVKDEKDTLTSIVRTPDEDKSLYKKGLAAGTQDYGNKVLSLEEKLAVLIATPEAHELAERVVVLEAALEEETGKKIKWEPAQRSSNFEEFMSSREAKIRTAAGIAKDKPIPKTYQRVYDAGWSAGSMAENEREARNAANHQRALAERAAKAKP
jgi:hypothetical protein